MENKKIADWPIWMVAPEFKPGAFPHRCPVCEGRGKVSGNFYTLTGTCLGEVTCRTCWSKGYIIVEESGDGN